MKIVFICIGIVVIFIMCVHCTSKLRTRKNSLEPFTYLQHAISSIANPNDVKKSRIEIISKKCVNDPKQCIIDRRMNNRQISWDVPNTSLTDQTISESTQKCIADPLACFEKEKESLKTSVDWDVYDKNKDEILKNIHDYYQTYFRETEYLSREERLEQMYIMWKFKRQTVKENSTVSTLPMVDHAIRTHFSNLGYLLTSNLNPSSLYIATVISNTGVTEYVNINDETHKNIISKPEQKGKLNRVYEGSGSDDDDEEEIVLHEITLSSPNMSFFELMLLMDSLYTATGKFKIEYPLGEDAFIEMKPILEDAIAMYRYNTNKKPTTSPLSVTPSILRDEYEFVLIDEEWIENTLKTFE